MMFTPPGMPPQMPQGMPFGVPQQQQIQQQHFLAQNPVQPQINPTAMALMQQQQPGPMYGYGQTAPGGTIGQPNSAPPFGTPPWMRPTGQ